LAEQLPPDLPNRPAPQDLPEDGDASYVPRDWALNDPDTLVVRKEDSEPAVPRWEVSFRGGLIEGSGLDEFGQDGAFNESATRTAVRRPSSSDQLSSGNVPVAPIGGPSYKLDRKIAQGGMGEVWEATQVSLGRSVAVKRMREEALSNLTPYQVAVRETEFRQEAIVTARLEHPNIVPVHDLGLDDGGRPLLAMKLVQGRTWESMLKEDLGGLNVADFLARHLPILVQMAQAVAFAHYRGIVHRDLKPAQIMVGEFGEVMLMDWGLALRYVAPTPINGDAARANPPSSPPGLRGKNLLFQPIPEDLPTPESATSPSGTPSLMAPEQTEPVAVRIGPWTDIYLLGGTLYFLLTGSYPHSASSGMASFLRATEGVIELPSKRAPKREVPRELEDLAMRCLRKNPRDRLVSAKQFIIEIEDFRAGYSKRRDAIQLIEQTRVQLATAGDQYDKIAECLKWLSGAERLWPENMEVSELRHQATLAYARAALKHHDLRLAEFHAIRMNDGPDRDQIRAHIEQEEATKLRRERQRRQGVAASFIFLILMVAIGSVLTMKLADSLNETKIERDLAESAQKESQLQRDEAAHSRQRSEDLAQFMISDLRNQLKSVDPSLRMLDSVAEKTLAYYESLPLVLLSSSERLRVFNGMMEVGLLFGLQGKPARALDAYRMASDVTTRYAKDPNASEWRLARARALNRLGDTHGALGDTLKAREMYQQGMRELEATAEDNVGNPLHYSETIMNLQQYARAINIMGDIDGSLTALERASMVAEQARQRFPNHGDLVRQSADIAMALGQNLMEAKRPGESIARLQEAKEFLSRLTDPTMTKDEAAASGVEMSLANLWSIEASLGYAKRIMGRTDESLEHMEKALDLLREQQKLTPSNSTIVGDIGRILRDIGVAHSRRGEYGLAEAPLREAEASFRKTIADDRTAIEYRTDLSIVLAELAQTRENMERHEEALPMLLESLALIEPRLEQDPANLYVRNGALMLLDKIARNYVLSGRYEEATPYLERAQTTGESLRGKTPAERSVVLSLMDVEVMRIWVAMMTGAQTDWAVPASRGLQLMQEVEESGVPDGPRFFMHRAILFAAAGRFDDARPVLEKIRDEGTGSVKFWEVIAQFPELRPLLPALDPNARGHSVGTPAPAASSNATPTP